MMCRSGVVMGYVSNLASDDDDGSTVPSVPNTGSNPGGGVDQKKKKGRHCRHLH